MKRKPAVAGQFYPSKPSALSEQIDRYIETRTTKEKAIGIVSPHAGIIYSGAVAGAVYSRIEFPHTFILMGPNHTGLGKPVSIMLSGQWEIPTGEIKIDENLSRMIRDHSTVIEEDSLAHTMEHSLEVQLPFIAHLSPRSMIVPITMMIESLELCKMIGETIADVIRKIEYPVIIVASTDMSHYEEDSVARSKDKRAIERITALDPEGLYKTIVKEGISMCGYIPTTAMLYAARKLGAKEGILVKYMTSGEVSGDYGHVVGYAGLIVK